MALDGRLGSILVIDDNDIDRAVMVEILEDAGFTVHDLPSPIGATRLAKQEDFAVVVIDQNMPSMDGSKLATLFRGNRSLQHLGLILVSGDDDVAEVAGKAGAAAFVAKAKLAHELPQVVARLQEHGSNRGGGQAPGSRPW